MVSSIFSAWANKVNPLSASQIQNRIMGSESIAVKEISKEQINASLPILNGTPLYTAVYFLRPDLVDTFLKHPDLDIKKRHGMGWTAPQLVNVLLEQTKRSERWWTNCRNLLKT